MQILNVPKISGILPEDGQLWQKHVEALIIFNQHKRES
jgi:hypothetical protein